MKSAKTVFERLGGPNFVTPTAVEYGWIVEGEIAYEISTGSGIVGEELWGVSLRHANGDLVYRDGDEYRSVGQLVWSLEAGRELVEILREEYA